MIIHSLEMNRLLDIDGLTKEQWADYVKRVELRDFVLHTRSEDGVAYEEEMKGLKNYIGLSLYKHKTGIEWRKVKLYVKGKTGDRMWQDLSGHDVVMLTKTMEEIRQRPLQELYEEWTGLLQK